MLTPEQFELLVEKVKQDPSIRRNEQEVRAKYGPMLAPGGIATLDPDQFKAYLTMAENRHWKNINRHSGRLTKDLPLLRRSLGVLVDETKPVWDRIDEARKLTQGRGLGRAVISAVLILRFPDTCGVYNTVSVKGLKEIGKYAGDRDPGFNSLSLGQQYRYVNQDLNELSAKHSISLWALDHVWGWRWGPG